MSIRLKWITAPLVALLASGCVTDVTQEESGAFLRTTFDPTRGAIPTPNDLALQASFRQPAGPTRSGLFTLIGLGGFFANPSALPPLSQASVISIPYELVVEGVATTATGASAGIDPATVKSTTLAILRVDTGGAPVYADPIVVATTAGMLRALPFPGTYAAGGRYVVALRGGPSGVRTYDGRTLAANSATYLIANGVNFSSPETRPSSLTPAQVADLTRLQGVLANPIDWTEFLSSTTCAAINAPAPSSAFVDAAAPNGACWVPLVTGVPGAPGSPPNSSALAAIGTVFPVSEAVSIQTFEIQ